MVTKFTPGPFVAQHTEASTYVEGENYCVFEIISEDGAGMVLACVIADAVLQQRGVGV
jgi:hypothetical protein